MNKPNLGADNAQDAVNSATEDTSAAASTVEQNEELDASDLDQDTELNGDEEGQEAAKPEEKKPKENGFKKRLDREKRKRLEIEQEREYWKREALKHASAEKPHSDAPKKATRSEDQEPDENDFEKNADYIRAYTKWELRQLNKESSKEAKERESQAQRASLQKDYDARLEEFKKAAPDFEEVRDEFFEEYADTLAKTPGELVESIMTSDFGPQIFYDLIKNPGEFERISKLSVTSQIREIGKIEARFSAQAESSKKIKTSKAPAPASPIGGRGGAAGKKSLYDKDLSFKEYEALRNERRK